MTAGAGYGASSTTISYPNDPTGYSTLLVSYTSKRSRAARLLHAIWTTLIPELLVFDSLVGTLGCIFCSFWLYKLGYWLGAQSSSPTVASIFADTRVLHGSFYPREVRIYVGLILASSLSTIIWSVCLGLRTLELEYPKDLSSAISLDLPITANNNRYARLTRFLLALSPRHPPAVVRAACVTRVKRFMILFCFSFAFIRRQYVGQTLIYHPVNSPMLLQEGDAMSIQAETAREVDIASLDLDLHAFARKHLIPVVPSIVHFVFGMDETFGGKPFAFAHYLSMYSAIAENKPKRVMFWYHYPPSTPEKPNWWFDRILHDAAGLGVKVELEKARNFDKIFGRKIEKFAHKADIIRLEVLLKYGGIYQDLDVYTIRSFAPLLHFDTVLGLEGGVRPMPRQGLCNGIIISAPHSYFLQRWYDSYRTFDKSKWAGHSVKKPLELATAHQGELLVLDPFALFYPGWNDGGLRMVHSRSAEQGGEGWDFDDSRQFAYHAWSSFTGKKWLGKINPDKIFEVETSFNILVRRWTTPELREAWRTAKAEGLVQ